MNWKFWQWARAKQQRREEELKNKEEMSALWALTRSLRQALQFRRAIESLGPAEETVRSALMVVDKETPVWQAVHLLLDIIEREEQIGALRPGLDAESRAYNNGRAACVADVRATLLQQWTKAQMSNRSQG